MPEYANGAVDTRLMVTFGSGTDELGYWEWQWPPHTLALHNALVARARARTGRTLRLRAGWSAYRPRYWQQVYRDLLGVGAAVPGTSSHGGKWEGQQTMAGDYEWQAVYGSDWQAWYEDCRAVGLTPGMISEARGYPEEKWHVIDTDPWGPIPAGLDATELSREAEQEDDMRAVIQGEPGEGNATGIIIQAGVPPYSLPYSVFVALCGAYTLKPVSLAPWQYETVVREQWTAFSVAQQNASKDLSPSTIQAIADRIAARPAQ